MHTVSSRRYVPVRMRFVIYLMLLVAAGFYCMLQLGFQAGMSAHDLTMAIPFQVSNGMRLYTDVFSFHPPLSTWFLAMIYRFADPITSLRILNLLFVLATGGLIFWTGRRLQNITHGWAGALFYLLWATLYNGIPFYVDGLVGSFSILILLLATFPPSPVMLVAIGATAGIGASLKPSAGLLLMVPLVWFLWSERRDRRTTLKRGGIVLAAEIGILLMQIGILALSGNLDMALRAMFNPGNSNWLLDFEANFFDGGAWRNIALTMSLVPAYLLLWIRNPDRIGLLTVLLLGATLVLNIPAPGYYHFMACLPIVALLSGMVLGSGIDHLRRSLSFSRWKQAFQHASANSLLLTGVMTGLIIVSLITAMTPVFGLFQSGVRLLGWDELRPISEWLRAHTNADERILILPAYDTNANIYAQSERLPMFYMKTWHHHASIRENIALLEERMLADPPTLIIFFPDLFVPVEPYFKQLQIYIDAHYEEVGYLDDIPLQGDVIFLSRIGITDPQQDEEAG